MNVALPRCAAPGSACRLLELDAHGPRPVWAVFDAAGARRFTGEISLRGLHGLPDAPVIRVWFDRGELYFAECEGDPPVGERLLAIGVISASDLEAGSVHLGGVSHLGRLFDRVPGLDRGPVELAVELLTGELVGAIADHVVEEVTVASYRHHPSGVVKWSTRSATPGTAGAPDLPSASDLPAGTGRAPIAEAPAVAVAPAPAPIADGPGAGPAVVASSHATLPAAATTVTAPPPPADGIEWRIDDRVEWYSDAPGVEPAPSVPAVSVPTVSVPTVSVPAVSVPTVSVPTVSVPTVSVPTVSVRAVATAEAPQDTTALPAFDVDAILAQVSAASPVLGAGAGAGYAPGSEPEAAGEIRAAVQAALAEIEAATRLARKDNGIPPILMQAALADSEPGLVPSTESWVAAASSPAPAPAAAPADGGASSPESQGTGGLRRTIGLPRV